MSVSTRLVLGICFLITLILFGTNFHILLFVGVYTHESVSDVNTTQAHFQCYQTDYYNFYPMWDQVHTFLYCFVPFFIMIVSNLTLARRLFTASAHLTSVSKSSVRKKRNVSVFCVAFSITFILCTVPQKICYGYLYERLNKSSGKWYGPFILRLADEINFSFTGLNFIFQLALNNMFRSEFLSISKRIWNKIQNSYSQTSRPPVHNSSNNF